MAELGDLTTGPVSRHLRNLAIPTSVGFFFHTMYNVVDTYFAGLISVEALAALSLSFPVFFIVIAMAAGTGSGATALISNALGAGDRERAEMLSAQTLSFAGVLGILVTCLMLPIAPTLFRLLGAEGTYLRVCLDYIDIILWGSVSFVLANSINAILVSKGRTKPFRNFLIGGFVLNLLLDPWFLYGGLGVPAMGIRGIALATILIEFLGVVYLLFEALKTDLVSKKCWLMLRPNRSCFGDLAHQSLPSSMNMIAMAVGGFVHIYFISAFGKAAVAAYGAALRIEQIALLPCIGLNSATLAIVGQNNGAGYLDRMRLAWKTALVYGFAVGTPAAAIILLFSGGLMSLFTDDAGVIKIGAEYLQIAAFILWAYILLFVSVAVLQGMKRPLAVMTIGLSRQIIFPILVLIIFVYVLEWGLFGVWRSIFLVTWSAAILTVFYTNHTIKRLA